MRPVTEKLRYYLFAIPFLLSLAEPAFAADVPEQEPNDNCPGMAINCGDVVVPAFLQPGELDWFAINGNAGEILTLETFELQPGDGTNTVLELYANDCNTLLAADDDGGQDQYSLIGGFPLPYTGVYHVLVAGPSPADQGPYGLITQCDPGGQGLSREEALDLVIENVIDNSEFADSLQAFLYDPPGPDSLLVPGTVLADWDSLFVETIPTDVFFFWLDDEPEKEWVHHTTYVLVDHLTGFIQTFEGDGYPVIDGNEIFDFVPDSPTENGMEYGSHTDFPSLNVTWTPKDHNNNTKTYGVIVAGKNLGTSNAKREGERKSRQQDVARYQRILNEIPNGPKIDKEKLFTRSGTNSLGASVEDVCTVLENLDENCTKLYFFYTGHGSDPEKSEDGLGGMILNGPDGKKKILTWDELAIKLWDTGIDEVCISIEACHSGDAIRAFKEYEVIFAKFPDNPVQLKGAAITSSSSEKPTYRNNCQGTPFIMALYDCWLDPESNLNGFGGTDMLEAWTWAVTRPVGPVNSNSWKVQVVEPKAVVLGDDDRDVTAHRIPKCWKEEISTGGKGFEYSIKEVWYEIADGKGPGEPTDVRRRRLYITNTSSSAGKATKPLQFYCNRKHPDNLITIRIGRNNLTQWAPSLGKGQRICLADVPANCKKIVVSKAPSSRDGGPGASDPFQWALPTGGGEDDDGVLYFDSRDAIYFPGEQVFKVHEVPGVVDDLWTTSLVEALPTWDLSIDPDSFLVPALMDTQMVLIRGEIPHDEVDGGEFLSIAANVDTGEEDRLNSTARIATHVPGSLIDGDVESFRAIRLGGSLSSTGSGVSLDHSSVTSSGSAAHLVDTGGSLTAFETVFDLESGASQVFEIRGTVDLNTVAVVEPDNGILIDSPTGTMKHGWVLRSLGDGLRFTGDLASLDFSYFDVDSAAANGATFDGVSNGFIDGLTIDDAGLEDVVVSGSSEVELRNPSVELTEIDVEAGSELTVSFDTWFVALDPNREGIPGVSVTVEDALGTTIADTVTDTTGFTEPLVLTQAIFDGPVQTDYTPHTVEVALGDWDTTFVYTAEFSLSVEIPIPMSASETEDPPPLFVTRLLPAAPNPLRTDGPLEIRYSLADAGKVKVELYDPQGRRVRSMTRQHKAGGIYATSFELDGLSSGTYFYRLKSDAFEDAQRVTILR